jgi:hypothetical protein
MEAKRVENGDGEVGGRINSLNCSGLKGLPEM